jgi:hypothetical protein
MKHTYGKAFEHELEAHETLKGFHLLPGIDGRNVVEARVVSRDGRFWLYVTLEGDLDPDELLAATGYQLIT